jgi:hypothetical protein
MGRWTRQRWIRVLTFTLVAGVLVTLYTESECRSYTGGTQFSQARIALRFAEDAIERYRAEHGALPAELKPLLAPPMRGDTDPWNRRFVYRPAPPDYRVYSTGANGIDENGDGDDVLSNRWDKKYSCDQYEQFCLTPCRAAKVVGFFVALASLLGLGYASLTKRLRPSA